MAGDAIQVSCAFEHRPHCVEVTISPVPEINGIVELRSLEESVPMAIKPIECCSTFYERLVQNEITVNLSVIEGEVFTDELRNDV